MEQGNTLINASPARIVLPYIIVSVLWVFCSDYILKYFIQDVNLLAWIHAFKDIAFVVITVAMLYYLARRDINAITTSYHEKIKRERIYRALIENGNDIIMLNNAEGKYIYVSSNAARVLGYSKEEFSSLSLLQIIHPDDYLMMKLMNEEILANPGEVFHAEYRVRHKDGSFLWFEGVKVNHLNDLAIGGVITNARDISKRKKAQMDLVHMNMELEQMVRDRTVSLIDALEKEKNLNKMKSRFVAFASHEFRTPLTASLPARL